VTTTLIACSHGTSDPAGRAAITAQIDLIARHVLTTPVTHAFVDVEEPAIDEVVRRHVAGGAVVVVPLLLSTGFHTNVDIARAVSAHPGHASAAPALGPHPLLADVMHDRLAAAGMRPGDAVVLAAAGSSDPAAAVDVATMATLLEARLNAPVAIGFAAGTGPRITDVVRTTRESGHERVAIASYVLAPGHFARVIASAGGDVVAAPLCPDPRIARIAIERFRTAARDMP